MIITKKLVQEIIDRLTLSILSVEKNKLKLAKDLFWAKNVINWRLTEYKFWSQFCAKHTTLSQPTISRYILIGELIAKYKYTNEECITMIAALGWFRFSMGMLILSRKLSVKGFIKKFKDYDTNTGDKRYQDEFSDRAYAFSLPAEASDRFDTWLIYFGASMPKNEKRRNMRSAMIKLINEKLS